MSDISRQDEPSMEEILASIRRIIAEDADATGKPNAASAEQDILELTDRVEPDGSVVSLAARLAPRSEPSPIAVAPYEPAPKAAPEPPPAVAETPAAPVEHSDRVISESAAAASIAVLTELARAAPRSAATGTPGDRALEDATRELLKPLLKAWLDTNLPAIIERIVREEIARLVREARDG
ncbi:MAG: DUF2497 domain-containing protein [Alphaproteobacteria bacterium]|nr:DUF2497 domain-containing protein [Alphaproteobacteria bacterium]